jgi:hypothetical protein
VAVGTFVVPHLLNIDVPLLWGELRETNLVSAHFPRRTASFSSCFAFGVSLLMLAFHIGSYLLFYNHIHVSATQHKN